MNSKTVKRFITEMFNWFWSDSKSRNENNVLNDIIKNYCKMWKKTSWYIYFMKWSTSYLLMCGAEDYYWKDLSRMRGYFEILNRVKNYINSVFFQICPYSLDILGLTYLVAVNAIWI